MEKSKRVKSVKKNQNKKIKEKIKKLPFARKVSDPYKKIEIFSITNC